jgi:hypothetical protein
VCKNLLLFFIKENLLAFSFYKKRGTLPSVLERFSHLARVRNNTITISVELLFASFFCNGRSFLPGAYWAF